MKVSKIIVCIGFFLSVLTMCGNSKGEEASIQDGSKVSFDYKLTVDGQVVDTSEGRGPFEYTHGKGMIVKGLEKALTGKKVGDEFMVEVSAEEGYGEVNQEAFREVAKASLPEGMEPAVGMTIGAQAPTGQTIPVKIAEVKEDSVVIDLNHPLAGKTLTFDVRVVSIE